MSASDDNPPEGASPPPDEPGTTPTAELDSGVRPHTLRSPLPPPPQPPGLAPMPDLTQTGAHDASHPVSTPRPAPRAADTPLEPDVTIASPSADDQPLPSPAVSPFAPPGDDPDAATTALPPLAPRDEGPGVRTPIAGYGQQVERGVWQRRDKVEANDPTDDEELLHVEGGEGWAIAGASCIGRGHLHDGKYREDSLAAAITPDGWHLVAVADGGGSYRLARVGAPLAAATAVATMRTALEGMTGHAEDTEDTELREERGEGEHSSIAEDAEGRLRADGTAGVGAAAVQARAALVAGMRAARRALDDEAKRRRAAGDEAVTAADLRTTLLLALHRALPDGGQIVAGAQVGDGLIAAREGTTGALHTLGAPETGAVGDETMFLPDVHDEAGEWEGRVRLMLLGPTAGPVHLLVLTDGVSDDFAPATDHLWRLERPLFAAALALDRPPAEAAAALHDLLGYQRTGSFDDRTLVCVYRWSAAP